LTQGLPNLTFFCLDFNATLFTAETLFSSLHLPRATYIQMALFLPGPTSVFNTIVASVGVVNGPVMQSWQAARDPPHMQKLVRKLIKKRCPRLETLNLTGLSDFGSNNFVLFDIGRQPPTIEVQVRLLSDSVAFLMLPLDSTRRQKLRHRGRCAVRQGRTQRKPKVCRQRGWCRLRDSPASTWCPLKSFTAPIHDVPGVLKRHVCGTMAKDAFAF
jgi:hypothetical protein